MDRDGSPQAKSPLSPSPPLEITNARPPDQDRRRTCSRPIAIGPLALPNRIAMAPLTRSRAAEGNVPTALNALYYAQRASAGLIISEATQVAPEGQGYISTPGIHSAEQIKGWQCVTGAVHASGGRIVLQLWHVGRISHQSFQPGGKLPVAPSAIKPNGQAFTANGFEPIPTPRALELAEIPGIVAQYAQGARNAIAAGFDGVEVHGANGYLIDQFLRDGTNKRTDAYGGSIENRTRFLLEVVDAVIAVGRRRPHGLAHLAAERAERYFRQRPAAPVQPRCERALRQGPRFSACDRGRHRRHARPALRL